MNESAQPTPARRFHWRRLFQFRLRTLLILTTVIALALGWWSYKARQQREAVAALRRVGPLSFTIPTCPWTGGMKEPLEWPQWLLKIVGKDYFANVYGVSLTKPQATDTDVEHLKVLTSLKGLNLSNTQVTDSGLEHLKNLTSLQTLILTKTQVTDAGLEHLKKLTSLQSLLINHEPGTDGEAARLQQSLPNCKILRYSR